MGGRERERERREGGRDEEKDGGRRTVRVG